MRKELEKVEGVRSVFFGEFVRYGQKTNSFSGKQSDTILLKNILDGNGKPVADHVWLNKTKSFEKVIDKVDIGTLLKFEARVTPYTKGYVNWREGIDERETDFKLSRPSKFKIVHSLTKEIKGFKPKKIKVDNITLTESDGKFLLSFFSEVPNQFYAFQKDEIRKVNRLVKKGLLECPTTKQIEILSKGNNQFDTGDFRYIESPDDGYGFARLTKTGRGVSRKLSNILKGKTNIRQ